MPRSEEKKLDEESVAEVSLTDNSQSWNDSQEKLLKGIAERSNCMRWLHTQCNLHFENMNFYFTIPNVIISTLNGSFTMSLTSLFPDAESQKAATTIIGLVSIFSAVLITMNQYVKSQQMMEAHRAAGLSYSKLHRMIMNELSIPRDQRSNGLEFLKLVRIEIDRLENTAPSILPAIIKKFNVQFADRQIEKPEIAGDLDEVEINKEIHKHHKEQQRIDNPSPSMFQTTVRTFGNASNMLFQTIAGPTIRRKPSSENLDESADQIVLAMSTTTELPEIKPMKRQ